MRKQVSHPEKGVNWSLISMSLSHCSADFLISCLLLACLKPRSPAHSTGPSAWLEAYSFSMYSKHTIAHRHVCTGTLSCTREITCCISNSHASSMLSLPLEYYSNTIWKLCQNSKRFFCRMEFVCVINDKVIAFCCTLKGSSCYLVVLWFGKIIF